uniref:HTH psq-type domain-containing protein n=1 Tax=Takifugu rubripes TaxID=31033 RepID=A0A674PNP0_TAKRU
MQPTPEDAPKGKRKMLNIAEKVKLLDMLKEAKSYAAVGCQYGINESSVRSIKEEENNIRRTAAISSNRMQKGLRLFTTTVLYNNCKK